MLNRVSIFLVAIVLSFPSLLCAQTKAFPEPSPKVMPLNYYFILPFTQSAIEQSLMNSGGWFSFIRSKEGERFRQWVLTGAAIGIVAGIIVASIKISSRDTRSGDGLAAAVAIPVVIVVHVIIGMLVGGGAGALGYLIFDYPSRESRQ